MHRTHFRYVIFALWPVLLVTLLVTTNGRVDILENLQRGVPFLLITLAKISLVILLVIQHPEPPDGIARWKFWTWVDPVTTLLVFMLLDSASYYASLWGNQSGRFTYETWMFDILRSTLLIVGYISIVIAQEMIYRSMIARKRRRMTRRSVYDIPLEEVERKDS